MRGGGIIFMVSIFIVLKGILSTEGEGYVDSNIYCFKRSIRTASENSIL
jgi:hypothetical protein